MTLEDFIQLLTSQVLDFETYWTEQAALNSAQFPNEMDDADWFDQFLAFLGISE